LLDKRYYLCIILDSMKVQIVDEVDLANERDMTGDPLNSRCLPVFPGVRATHRSKYHVAQELQTVVALVPRD